MQEPNGNGLRHGTDSSGAAFDFGKEVARISHDLPAGWVDQVDTPTRQALLQKLDSLAFEVSMEVCDGAQMRLKPFRQLRQQLPHNSSPFDRVQPAHLAADSTPQSIVAQTVHQRLYLGRGRQNSGLAEAEVKQGTMNGQHGAKFPLSRAAALESADVEMQPVSQTDVSKSGDGCRPLHVPFAKSL